MQKFPLCSSSLSPPPLSVFNTFQIDFAQLKSSSSSGLCRVRAADDVENFIKLNFHVISRKLLSLQLSQTFSSLSPPTTAKLCYQLGFGENFEFFFLNCVFKWLSTAIFAYRLRLLRRLERTTFNCQNQINLTTMDYLKSFWWKPTTKDEPQPNVEFSTITTSAPVNSAYFSIIHEVKTSGENRQSNATSNDLPSPNESFHTVKSSFNETPSSMGVSNLGYTGSHQDVTTSKSASTQPQTSTFTHQHQQPSNHQLSSDTYI